jgi:hypothetical protein
MAEGGELRKMLEEKFKHRWDEKNQVLREYMIGDQNEEDARKSVEEARRITTSLKEKGIRVINFLFDASRAGVPSSKARRIYADWLNEGIINKTAVFGGGVLQRTVANFIFAFIGKKEKMKYFANEKEAMAWIKE